jgi:hypothetical protein
VKLADGLVTALGEDEVRNAYFQGDKAPYAKVVKALGQLQGKTGFTIGLKRKERTRRIGKRRTRFT